MRARLKIRPAEGDPFTVDVGNTATIGRSRDNTVSLHFSQHVSRQHAIIRCHNAFQYQIMDLAAAMAPSSTDAGHHPTLLNHGAVIRITNNEIIFEQNEDAPADVVNEVTMAAGTDASEDQSAVVA